jgi:hypothetical protein
VLRLHTANHLDTKQLGTAGRSHFQLHISHTLTCHQLRAHAQQTPKRKESSSTAAMPIRSHNQSSSEGSCSQKVLTVRRTHECVAVPPPLQFGANAAPPECRRKVLQAGAGTSMICRDNMRKTNTRFWGGQPPARSRAASSSLSAAYSAKQLKTVDQSRQELFT